MAFFGVHLLHILVVALGGMSIGMVLSYFSPAYTTIVKDFNLNETEQGAFNALAPICAIFGGPLINFAMGRYGRKLSCIICQIFILIGWILLAVSNPKVKWLLYISRIFKGLGSGASSCVTPVYIDELSPEDVRGAMGVMSQMSVSIGSTICYAIESVGWRNISIISMVPCIILFIAIFFIPESPVTIAMKDPTNASKEPKELAESLWQKQYVKPLVISFLLMVFMQFSGINALLTNLGPIFSQSNIPLSTTVASVLVSLAQIVAMLAASPAITKIGRRACWTVSVAGQAAALLLSWANEKWPFSNVVPVVCLFFDVLFFGFGLGPLPWFVVPQIFPDSVRSTATAVAQAANWAMCSAMVFLFPILSRAMSLGWVYFAYGIVMIIAVFYGIFLLPKEERMKAPEITEDRSSSPAAYSLVLE